MTDAVVNVLLDKLVTLLINEGRQLLEFDSQFEETKEELSWIQKYLEDIEHVKRKDRSEILKKVVIDLREVVYDVQDIIAHADYQLLFQKKHLRFVEIFKNSRRLLGRQVREINQKISNVKENMKSFLPTAHHEGKRADDESLPFMTYPILIDETEMVGLEDDSAKIRKWILEANGPLTVIGIVGMGGIGKTTLAQKIFSSTSLENTFKHSIMVTVSQSFQLDELLKKMMKKLDEGEESLRGMETNDLLEKLKSKLDKRYLVILDDVWSIDGQQRWWERLKWALPPVIGSCVIVTTRNEEVTKSMGATDQYIHRLEVLSAEDSQALFNKVAFAKNEGKCPDPSLQSISEEIVGRCAGLPLTIKVVGGMMLASGYSIHEWKRISKHLKEELETTKRDELLHSCPELSYEELPNHLKPCLLWLAMYPEDHKIPIRETIYTLIGEGFVWGRNGKTATEVGEEYFIELFNRCLIVGQEKDMLQSRFLSYRMHDMIRKMAIRIAKEENFVSLDSKDRPVLSERSRRVVMFENTTAFANSMGNNSKLRTLVMLEENENIISLLKINLCKFTHLRVLRLSFSNKTSSQDAKLQDWLSVMGSLRYLIYLRIQNSTQLKTLPNSIRNLRNLQILILFGCKNLERLPPSITILEKLTNLHVLGCDSFRFMPEGIAKLSKLEELSYFRPANSRGTNNRGCQITELKNLTKLIRLGIEIDDEEQIQEGEWNSLSKLQQLQVLTIEFRSNRNIVGIARKIDQQFSAPLQCLMELWLIEYPGERTPAWLNPTSLPNLRYLAIARGGIREMGSGFWYSTLEATVGGAAAIGDGVWKLEVFVLFGLDYLEEDWARMRGAMPYLRRAIIICCDKVLLPAGDFYLGEWRKEDEKGKKGATH